MDQNNYGQTDNNLPGQNPVSQSDVPQNLPGQNSGDEPVVPQDLPGQQSIGQTPSSPNLSEKKPTKIFRTNIKSNNNSTIFVLIVTVVVIIIIGLIILFSGGDGESTGEAPAVVLPDSGSGENVIDVVEEPLIGVEKDSILRSEDSGLSFETYFFLATEERLGSVDVLNISFHPKMEGEIVVSTYDDGLFINKESSVNKWNVIYFPQQKIYSFIIDKYDPDYRAFASGVVSENGRIFRTEDKGETWRAVYAEPGDRTYVSSLTQDPVNQNIIIAGTSAGTLIRSVDGGDTWNNIGQDITGKISDFTHDSDGTSMTYLLVEGREIYHSYDAGLNWLDWEDVKDQEIRDLNTQATALSRAGDRDGYIRLREQSAALRDKDREEGRPTGIVTIVADPNRTGILYAGLRRGLYRSVDYGKYWQPVNIIESAEKFAITSIAVNPDNSDEISFVAGNSFYRSVNNGVSWAVTPLDKTRNASFVAYDPFDTNVIYIGLSAEK